MKLYADSLIGEPAPDFGGGFRFHHSNVPEEEFLGIHIKLPKIPVGRIIGNVVKDVVPGGKTIVGVANTAIDLVKNSKLQPKDVLRNVPTAAVDAAKAQIQGNISTQVSQANPTFGAAVASSPWIIPAVLVVLVLMIGRK